MKNRPNHKGRDPPNSLNGIMIFTIITIILQYHEIFFRLTAPRCPGMAAGAVSLRKSHDIVMLSFCYIAKG